MNLHQSRCAVGALDVDARTGTMLDQAQRVAAIQSHAAAMASTLPAYAPNPNIAVKYLAPNAVTAENDRRHGSS
jgi:hypothetical protein